MKINVHILFIVFLLSCSNPRSEKKTAIIQAEPTILIKFEKNSTNINFSYIDEFNDSQTFLSNGLVNEIKIKSKQPLFLFDWSGNQTYYVLMPNEVFNVVKPKIEGDYLSVNIKNGSQTRINELLFFQELSKEELTKEQAKFNSALRDGLLNKGRDQSGKAMILLNRIKNKQLMDADKSFTYIKNIYSNRLAFSNNYFDKHNVTANFKSIVLNYFLYEYNSDALTIAVNSLRNKRSTRENLDLIASKSLKLIKEYDNTYIPTYQSMVKSYLSYVFLKNEVNTTAQKISLIKNNINSKSSNFPVFLIIKSTKNLDVIDSILKIKATDKAFFKYANYVSDRNKFLRDTYGTKIETILLDSTLKKQTFSQAIGAFKGKIIVIDFWASWCIPCKDALPFSKLLDKKTEKNGVVFIYLSLDEDFTAWKSSASQMGLIKNSYIVKDNFKSILSKNLKIKSIPRYVIIDKKGKIIEENAPSPRGKLLEEKLLQIN